jgi:archaellum component FlaG (FlaF/FlaG flagellin family)
MGFETVATQLLFFIAVVGLSAGVLAVFADYLQISMGAVRDRQTHITSQLRTDIRISSIDNSSGYLHIYVKNIGDEILRSDCVELYVDGAWVTVIDSRKTNPATGAQMSYWRPGETLKINPQSAPLGEEGIHTARVITCNGVVDTKHF